MILNEFSIEICVDDEGYYFESEEVDLDEKTLSVPCRMSEDEPIGVMEVFRRKWVYHPANGESINVPIERIIEFFSQFE